MALPLESPMHTFAQIGNKRIGFVKLFGVCSKSEPYCVEKQTYECI